MKKILKAITIITLLFVTNNVNSQTIWTGKSIVFNKPNNSDWTLSENQDQITENISITRANSRGIFNIIKESIGGQSSQGPQSSDTEWAFGSTDDGINNLSFTTWGTAHKSNPKSLIDKKMVVHLISEDIYLNIKFLSWGNGNSGAGFSYERSTNQTLKNNSFTIESKNIIYPNPSKNFIQLSNSIKREKYIIFNIFGQQVTEGYIENSQKINVSKLKNGVYFLKIESKNTLKFIKN